MMSNSGTTSNTRRRLATFMTFAIALAFLAGCSGESEREKLMFRILSGSENQPLESIVQDFADREQIDIEVTYQGSIDIMRELANGTNSQFDAVWPANSMWILLGDTTGSVQLSSSIMRSPVVLGVKKSVAERLGWVGVDVTVSDVLSAAEAGQLNFMMANATQSDSGAAAYLGFLYAFAGQPDILTSADLHEPAVQDQVKRILGTVSRTAGNSAFLKDLFLSEYDDFDGMVNYESAIIETNQALVASNREPLYVLYLTDGTAIADSPFAYIDKGDPDKRSIFQDLQAYLQSDDVQRELIGLGRRGGIGINPDPASIDLSVFNPDWGIDTQRVLTPIKIPDAAVVTEALSLYQTSLRKPSFTVLLLDFSSSMSGAGQTQLKAAMRQLLDQQTSAQYLLQASPGDITIVVPFNDQVIDTWTVEGNDPTQLQTLIDQIEALPTYGGTDIYQPVMHALQIMRERGTDGFFPAVVLLTDGRNESPSEFSDLEQFITEIGSNSVPVFAITFGDASEDELKAIARFTSGEVFDGRSDLVGTFRTVRGYA